MKKATGLLLLASVVSQVAGSSCAVSDSNKKDCGYTGINESGCVNKGCCWSPAGENSATPWCYYADTSATGYSLSAIKETETGYTGTLTLIGSGTSTYGADIKTLKIDVVLESADAIRVRITDAENSRWEIPESVVARSHATSKPAAMNYKFSYSESPFAFEVTRVSDGVTVFEMDNSFVFKDQYIELTTLTNQNAKTFGLGESTRMNHALTSGTTYTGWALDQAALTMNKNLYGSLPFYMQMLDGAAHGVMLFNSNGMDTTVKDSSITFKTIGGVVDLYVFLGPTPAAVVQQYTAIVGKPAMMPYWSLGFHNCKYGYTSLTQVQQVVANYSAAGIPLDTQWMDIDYMQDYRDFTTSSTAFPTDEVAKFVAQLHDNGQHFVPIVDPGIMVMRGYDAYEQGLKKDLFVKDLNGDNYLGQVWPGPTFFPDFFHPSAQAYWTEQLAAFHKSVEPDGIWIDMNEVSNFCNTDGTGQVCANTAASGCPAPGASQTDCCLQCSTVDSSNKYDFPPYSIGNSYGKLSTKTMAVSGSHYGNVTVYDAHNLYGLTEQIATNKALTDIRGKRPFLLTRSSFLSTGVHSAKWTGDNGATWNDLKSSIISVLDFNMFGIPMVGADICGFIYDTTEELCARWIEVGAFYPFVRNHNALGQTPQEFYLWPTVTAAAQNALSMRYQMLPYLYTLFYQAHSLGATVARALWMNFPSDSVALGVDRQFMLGSSILISPVLDAGVTSVSAYFPQGYWYDFVSRTLAVDASAAGVWKTLSTPLTSVNVHIKGGSVLPLQEAAMTTTLARQTPFTLVAALCPYGQAWGSLFWDDGEQINLDAYLTVDYHAEVTSSAGSFTGVVATNTYTGASALSVPSIQFLGASAAPTSAVLNGVTLSSSQISFDATAKILTFSGLSLKVTESFSLTWSL